MKFSNFTIITGKAKLCESHQALKTLLLAALLIFFFNPTAAQAQPTPQFNIVKPSTTGVPGEEVRIMRLDPAGNLWIAGRYPFWGESALAMLSADQLPYEPLPGGGFETGAWRVWSSVRRQPLGEHDERRRRSDNDWKPVCRCRAPTAV